MRIENGTGKGLYAGVNEDFRLLVDSSVRSAQSRTSLEKGDAYQVQSAPVSVTTGDQEILVIKNSSSLKSLVITFIRIETIGVAAATATAFSSISMGKSTSTGGTTVSATNLNTQSGKTPNDVTFVDGSSAITVTGTQSEIDRNYIANDEVTYDKDGSIVLGVGGMLNINFIGSTNAGDVRTRVSFYLINNVAIK